MKILLKISNLSSGYQDTIIINEIDMKINESEIVTIIGPNGAGKSTLLKTIFGIIKPKNGEIRFKERQIERFEPFKIFQLGISYVPQIENIFPSLTVMENLDVGFYTSNIKNVEKELDRIFNIFPSLWQKKSTKA